MVVVSAPGKLLLSGEWSVLEKNAPCIVLAVDSSSTVKLKKNKATFISSPRFGIKKIRCVFDGEKLALVNATKKQKEILRFVQSAAQTGLKYVEEKKILAKNFWMTTDSKKNSVKMPGGSYHKVGFGSSAAITVAVIGAILEFHGIPVKKNKEKIYKLATIAHFLGQGKIGSGFDIAAATFGGAIEYKRFDKQWLQEELEKNTLEEITEKEWPGFEAKKLVLPKNFEFVVAFSGKSASTKELVNKMNAFKENKKEEYFKIIEEIKKTTQKLIGAINISGEKKITELIHNNRVLLKELGEKSGNNLETKELSKIIETINSLGGAAKFSGAGGGDCAIGVCFSKEKKQEIFGALKEKGLNPLQVNISNKGVTRVQ